jgi:hypothetical protein
MVVFFKKVQTALDLGFLPEDDVPYLLGLGWSRAPWRRQSTPRASLRSAVSLSDQQSLIRKRQKRGSLSEEVVPLVVTQNSPVNDSKDLSALSTGGTPEVSML